MNETETAEAERRERDDERYMAIMAGRAKDVTPDVLILANAMHQMLHQYDQAHKRIIELESDNMQIRRVNAMIVKEFDLEGTYPYDAATLKMQAESEA